MMMMRERDTHTHTHTETEREIHVTLYSKHIGSANDMTTDGPHAKIILMKKGGGERESSISSN